MERLNCRLEQGQIQILDELAGLLGMSRSEMMRRAVRELVKFYTIAKSERILEREELRDVIIVFLESREMSYVLRKDLEVLVDELQTSFGKGLIEVFEKKKKGGESKNARGKN